MFISVGSLSAVAKTVANTVLATGTVLAIRLYPREMC